MSIIPLSVIQAQPTQKITGVVQAQPNQTISGVTQAKPTATIIPFQKFVGPVQPKVPIISHAQVTATNSTPVSTLTKQDFANKVGLSFSGGEKALPAAQSEAQFRQNNPSPLTFNQTGADELAASARAPFRAGLATLASAVNNPNPIQATSPAQRFFVGDEPVTPIARQVSDQELQLKQAGFNKSALPLALAGTVSGTALDLLPTLGGGEGKIEKELLNRLVDKYGKDVAEQITKKGGRDLALAAISDSGEQVVKKAGIELPTKVNIYKPNEPGAFPKALSQATELPKTPQEKIGFKTQPILQTNLETNPQAGFVNPKAMVEDTKSAALKGKTEFFDRYAPIQDLVKDSKLKPESNPYIAARNYAGHVGKIENRLDELGSILKPNKDILPDVKQYALLDRYQELLGRGITKLPDGLTPEKVATQKAAIEARLGPEGMARVNEALAGIRGYNDKLLTEAKDAGIISQESFDAIKKNNQKYVPLQRLDYLAENGDTLKPGANSFSVSSQNLVKKIKGSEKAVADPIESMVRNTYNTVNLVERNKVATQVADLSKLPEFKGIVTKIDGAVPMGMEKISVFRNGIKEEYAVPKGVGEALKGLNQQSTDLITKWASKSSAALRMGATSLNVGFIPSNAIRDYQTATLVSKVGFTPVDWLKGFSEAISKGKDYKAFLESGGASGFFEGQKNLPKTVAQLTQGKTVKVLKTVLNPVELLRTIGETVELAPRLGVFKRSLGKGLSSTEAAFNARNATVDFAKSGNTMKVLNQWIPFLNARLQGNVNMLTAIKDRPISSAFKLGAMVGIPAVATYLNNTKRFPEIWNDISTTDKRNNFIIIYGNGTDANGNPTQAIKIPKGDAKVFANPLENFMAYLNKTNPKSLSQLAIEVGSDLSPIDFEDKGKFSPRSVTGSLLPPAIKGVVEGITNKNLYTGYDIVPQSMINASPREQYDNKTSTIAKELGQYLNWSPKKIDNFIKTQFGGLGPQLTSPTTAGSQVAQRFVGAHGGQVGQDMADEAAKAVQAQADKKVEQTRRAQVLLDRFTAEDPAQAAQDFDSIAKADSGLAKAIVDLKTKKDLGFTSKDYVIEQLQVDNGERAKFLVGQFSKLTDDKQKAALWDDLVNKKLITSAVADEMTKLLAK